MGADVEIALRRLPEVDRREIIALMNHPLLARHMPLLKSPFTESDCDDFLAAKERLWAEHGYGPWAFLVNERFAGWGGFQPEHGEADLAMVLHPDHWGHGAAIYEKVIAVGFDSMGFESVTALLPVSRKTARAMRRLGFRRDGEVHLHGRRFRRYRLDRDQRIV